jgi:NADH-quinone oxidoreductase subunit N
MFSLQFRWDILIAVLAIVTMTTGNIMALLQKDLKRLLAYSSISQIGYMLIGLAVAGTPGSSQANIDGLTGLFMHVFNHSLMKGLAFLSAGALIYKLGSRELTNLKGVGRLMPITSVSLSISLLALGGVPSFSGFISKYTLFLSAFEGGMPMLAIAGILNSGLSMAYYLRVIQTIFLAKPEKDISRIKEVPISMLMVLIAMAALITIFGLWPGPLFGFSQNAAVSLLQIGEYVRRIIPL